MRNKCDVCGIEIENGEMCDDCMLAYEQWEAEGYARWAAEEEYNRRMIEEIFGTPENPK